MQKIHIMTDSACDIPPEQEQALGIEILQIPITVDGRGYHERRDFTNAEFYEMLGSCEGIPATSHITHFEFAESYARAYENGATDIIHVTINSGGSAMYQAAQMAKSFFFEEHPDAEGHLNIHLVDSKTYTIAYGWPIMEAAKMARDGKSAPEIVDYLTDWFDSIEIYFSVYSLEFVKKSGRVSAAAAFVGELLGFKPIISLIDGPSSVITKVRGDKAMIPGLVAAAKKSREASGEAEPPYLMIHGSPAAECDELQRAVEEEFGYPPLGSYEAGCAITINSGPKVIGVIIKGKNRKI